MTDINEDHSWKDEVEDLNQRIFQLNQELVASQLMTGLILKKTGPVEVLREEISKGLPGHSLSLKDMKNNEGIIFSLESNNE